MRRMHTLPINKWIACCQTKHLSVILPILMKPTQSTGSQCPSCYAMQCTHHHRHDNNVMRITSSLSAGSLDLLIVFGLKSQRHALTYKSGLELFTVISFIPSSYFSFSASLPPPLPESPPCNLSLLSSIPFSFLSLQSLLLPPLLNFQFLISFSCQYLFNIYILVKIWTTWHIQLIRKLRWVTLFFI